MNLSLPIYRNSFHPAWLLLLLPPVLGLVLLAVDLDGAWLVTLLARILLAAAFVGPLVWWRDSEAPPAIRRWMKELRPQLPGCLLALVLPGFLELGRIGGPPPKELWGWVLTFSLLGCPVMGATLFGEEFEHRTMASLLSQPRPRSSIYLQKLGTLAVLLLVTGLNTSLILASAPSWSFSLGGVLWVLAVGFGVFLTTPLFTLLTRSTLAGAVFTAAAPALIVGFVTLAIDVFSRLLGVSSPESWIAGWLWVGVPVYLVICAWLGWREFARLQVRDAGGNFGHLGFHPLSVPTDRLMARFMPAGWFGQLVRKELRLHVVPWLVSGILIGLWALLLVTRAVVTNEEVLQLVSEPQLPVILAGLMGALSLLVAGAACVAEERQLGTLDWQLTQPLTLACQWRVKVAVSLGLALLCGVGLPVVLLRILLGAEPFTGAADSGWTLQLALGSAIILLAHSLAVYASSFSRSTMKATAAAIGLGVGVWGLLLPVVVFMNVRVESLLGNFTLQAEELRMEAPTWIPSKDLVQTLAIAFAGGLVVVFLSALLLFGSRNFRGAAISRSAVFRQFVVLALLVILPTLLLAEGLGQLVALNHRAHLAGVQADLLKHDRKVLLDILKLQETKGAVDSDLLRQLSLPPGSSPQTITETLLQNSKPREIHQWAETLTLWKAALSKTNAPTPTTPAGVFYRMDPRMARRYGLLPADPKANAGNPPASTPPK